MLGNGNGGTRTGQRKKSSMTAFFEFMASKQHTAGTDSHSRFISIPASIWQATKVTLYSNYVNILLVFVPLGIVAGAMGWNPTVVFVLNFFAIVPLAAVLSFATEEISLKLGQTMGGLLNATFGNAVELIVSGDALRNMLIIDPSLGIYSSLETRTDSYRSKLDAWFDSI